MFQQLVGLRDSGTLEKKYREEENTQYALAAGGTEGLWDTWKKVEARGERIVCFISWWD